MAPSPQPTRVYDDGTQPITSTHQPAPAWGQPGAAAPKPISNPNAPDTAGGPPDRP